MRGEWKQQEAIKGKDPKKVMVRRELRGEWMQKEAAGGYISKKTQDGHGRKRVRVEEAEGSSRRL